MRDGFQYFIAALLIGVCAWLPVHANDTTSNPKGPGYYQFHLGGFKVTALCDGTDMLPASKVLTNISEPELKQYLANDFLSDPVATSINAYVIDTGIKIVLIDTGAGDSMGAKLGNVAVELRAAGYDPEQIDEVLLTHMHPDHVGGLVVAGQPAFPRAVVRASREEADYWLDPAQLEAAPAADKSRYQLAADMLGPYLKLGRFKTFESNATLESGIQAIASSGHTPGHTSYEVKSRGEKLLVWGDLVHVAAVQFPNPAVALRFDVDSKAATAQRTRAFKEAAAGRYWIAGAHLPFPGIGHVRYRNGAYEWVPANYAALH
jgi:glyoxylase-like metal-dependent hydrolase (beta-lactamase superfamily II)